MVKRESIKLAGYITVSSFFIFAIIAVILAGIDYNMAQPDWISNKFSATSPVQIACVVFSIVLAAVGYPVFAYPNSNVLVTYEVCIFVSLCFNFAIGCLVIAAGSIGYIPLTMGCNAKISGMLEIWDNMDTYLHNVDQALCSKNCPCAFNGSFTDDMEYASIYKTWVKSNASFGPISFANCTGEVKTNVYEKTKKENEDFDIENTFDVNKFSDYMGMIEEKFNCVGWCSTSYQINKTNSTKMIKYLFSNINNGIPQHFGCVDQVIEWLPQYLLSNGACTLVQVVFQIIIFILCIKLGNAKGEEFNKGDIEIQNVNPQ